MHEIRAEIDINAPKEKVWDIWVGFEKWGEWNPIVNKAEGKGAVGEPVNITLANLDGSDGPTNSPIIADFIRPNLFRWNVIIGSADSFSNDKILELTETASGTHVVHTETFNGEQATEMFEQMKDDVTKMLNTMNEALKTTAEEG